MLSDRPPPGSAADWLQRARGDLALAAAPLPEGAFYEDLCYHAQQAAEKALKSIFVHHGWTFRYVHDLDELISSLQVNGLEVPEDASDAVVLSPYAFEARYPGVGEPVTEEERDEAVKLAQQVVDWAATQVEVGQRAESNDEIETG